MRMVIAGVEGPPLISVERRLRAPRFLILLRQLILCRCNRSNDSLVIQVPIGSPNNPDPLAIVGQMRKTLQRLQPMLI